MSKPLRIRKNQISVQSSIVLPFFFFILLIVSLPLSQETWRLGNPGPYSNSYFFIAFLLAPFWMRIKMSLPVCCCYCHFRCYWIRNECRGKAGKRAGVFHRVYLKTVQTGPRVISLCL